MKNIFKTFIVITLFFSFISIAFAANVNLTVRDGATVVFTGTVSLPTGITSIADDTQTSRTIDQNSVLATISSAASQAGSGFSISDLQYYSSFGSLYLKCITDTIGKECDNWQYAVNGSYPSDGMAKDILSGGENVYVYFGPQDKTILSENSITTNDTLTVTAQKYDYQNNAWVNRTGVTVGLTQPDPNNTFSPIEVVTKPVDTNGQAVFSSIPVGAYNVGIKEDYYFPTESLAVIEPQGSGGGQLANISPTTTPATTTTPSTNTESATINTPTDNISIPIKPTFDTQKAYNFLSMQQKKDGTFGDDLYTDWVAIASASGNNQEQIIELTKYLSESKITNPNLTDYERRAMALMALGLNPYNTDGENYIDKIVTSFDGKQFGDKSEDSDDIFALIVLQNAGYTKEDSMINTDISFVLNSQQKDGSWDESIDETGAAMEALSSFNQDDKIKTALTNAETFLKHNQLNDGSWNENASSTAWALEGILAQGEKPEDWKTESGNTPFDFLNTIQDTDGGVRDESLQNKIWETAYVVSAMSGKTWNQIMQQFSKEVVPTPIQTTKVATRESKNNVMTTKNIQNEAKAAIINAIIPSPEIESKTTTQISPSTSQENWLVKLWNSIF